MKDMKAKKLPKNNRLPRKFLKIEGEYYRCDDTVFVNEENDKSSVATIENIWWNFEEATGQVHIRWFYKPKDIGKKGHKAELYDSDLKQEIDMEMIGGKAKVYKSFQKFQRENNPDSFFTRAFYYTKSKKLEGDTSAITN